MLLLAECACFSQKQDEIDNVFIKRYISEYKNPSIFEIQYLKFFANDSEKEIKSSIENSAKYTLKGDFNFNYQV